MLQYRWFIGPTHDRAQHTHIPDFWSLFASFPSSPTYRQIATAIIIDGDNDDNGYKDIRDFNSGED
jgi:hypothetical protein